MNRLFTVGQMDRRLIQHLAGARGLAAGITVAALCGLWFGSASGEQLTADLLLRGGTVYDGSGSAPIVQDIAVTGERITFVGDADAVGISALETLDVQG